MKKILYWLPRVLSIALILFLGLFSLDIFDGSPFSWQMIVGFTMHSIPSLALLVLLIIAWKKEKIGGILFIVLSIIFTIFFKTYQEPISFLIISLPVFVIGLLFLLNGIKKK